MQKREIIFAAMVALYAVLFGETAMAAARFDPGGAIRAYLGTLQGATGAQVAMDWKAAHMEDVRGDAPFSDADPAASDNEAKANAQ